MAFTKTPYLSTHQFQHFPVTGSNEYLTDSNGAYGSRFINCEPRRVAKWGTDPQHILQKRPSVSTYDAYAETYLRGALIANGFASNILYTVRDNKIKRGVTDITTIGSNQADYVGSALLTMGNVDYVIHCDPTSSNIYVWNDFSATNTTVALTGVQSVPVVLDNYVFVLVKNVTSRQRIYNSAPGNPTSWTTGTDFLDAEMFPDQAVTIAKHKNHLVVFGERSVEFFYDAANQLGSPLTRSPQYASQIGLQPLNIAVKPYEQINDDIYFIGKDGSQLGVYVLSDFQIKKISNLHIDRLLNNNAGAYKETADAMCTVGNYGVQCLLLKTKWGAANKYYCYNPVENVWTEWVFFQGTLKTFDMRMSTNNNVLWGYYNNGVSATAIAQLTLASDEDATGHEEGQMVAIWRPDYVSFDNALPKHVKWLDIHGQLGNNTVTLEYSKSITNTPGVLANSYTQSARNEYPVRFRNLGRGIGFWYKFTFVGTNQIAVKGFDLYYNQGSV